MIFLNFYQPLSNIQSNTPAARKNTSSALSFFAHVDTYDLDSKFVVLNSKNLAETILNSLAIDDVLVYIAKFEKSETFFPPHYRFIAVLQVKFFFNTQDDLEKWLETSDIHLPKEHPNRAG